MGRRKHPKIFEKEKSPKKAKEGDLWKKRVITKSGPKIVVMEKQDTNGFGKWKFKENIQDNYQKGDVKSVSTKKGVTKMKHTGRKGFKEWEIIGHESSVKKKGETR